MCQGITAYCPIYHINTHMDEYFAKNFYMINWIFEFLNPGQTWTRKTKLKTNYLSVGNIDSKHLEL